MSRDRNLSKFNGSSTPSEKSESLWNVARENHAETEHEMTQKEVDDKRKTAVQLEPFNYGIYNIWGAFDFLLKKWKAWENVFMDLNWKKVYSFGVETEDDLYLQYYWKTKFECDKETEKARQEYEVKRKKEKLEALEKVPWRIEEGKKYIDESKWEAWEKYVKSRVEDLYEWKDVAATLELLKLIDAWEDWKKVQKVFDDQDHSGYSYSVVRNDVVNFSKDPRQTDRKLRKPWHRRFRK